MGLKPFLKWAGGKRWLIERTDFNLPDFSGKYIEPFLGGGAVYFSALPNAAIISDVNPRLVETYQAIRDDWSAVVNLLAVHHEKHKKEYYYSQRDEVYCTVYERAAQFLYLNRTCWNGLYRENLKGKFNVPIGTKSTVLFENDNFEGISNALQSADIYCCDFEITIERAIAGDLIFVDPPYTTAHNMNGFVKYNQKIFSWADQVRLRDALIRAVDRGCAVISTNAWHESILDLYESYASIQEIPRASVISGTASGRKITSESLIIMGVSE